jgi:hypothetical protein
MGLWVGYLFVVRQHVNANADRLLIPDHAERTSNFQAAAQCSIYWDH